MVVERRGRVQKNKKADVARSVGKEPWMGVCYFHQTGVCSKGNACRFRHEILSKDVFEQMPKPVGKPITPPTNNGSIGKANEGTQRPKLWCASFLRGECIDCNLPHLNQAAVDKLRAALRNQRTIRTPIGEGGGRKKQEGSNS